jgi:hypothetical protein
MSPSMSSAILKGYGAPSRSDHMQVPIDGRPQISGMMALAHSLDAGRSLPWRQVSPDRYILEDPPRPRAPVMDSSPASEPTEIEGPKSAARALWPHLP